MLRAKNVSTQKNTNSVTREERAHEQPRRRRGEEAAEFLACDAQDLSHGQPPSAERAGSQPWAASSFTSAKIVSRSRRRARSAWSLSPARVTASATAGAASAGASSRYCLWPSSAPRCLDPGNRPRRAAASRAHRRRCSRAVPRGARARPCARRRRACPARRISTRSHTACTSCRMCVDTMTVGVLRELADQLAHVADLRRVEAVCRLVENDDVGRVQQRLRDTRRAGGNRATACGSARWPSRRVRCAGSHRRSPRACAPRRPRAASPRNRGNRSPSSPATAGSSRAGSRCASGSPRVSRPISRSSMRTVPLLGSRKPVIIFMIVVLPAPLWPEQADDLAALDAKRDVVDCGHVAIAAGQVLCLDHVESSDVAWRWIVGARSGCVCKFFPPAARAPRAPHRSCRDCLSTILRAKKFCAAANLRSLASLPLRALSLQRGERAGARGCGNAMDGIPERRCQCHNDRRRSKEASR